MMGVETRQCSGPCGRSKSIHFFSPAQWKKKKGALCRECLHELSKEPRKRQRGGPTGRDTWHKAIRRI